MQGHQQPENKSSIFSFSVSTFFIPTPPKIKKKFNIQTLNDDEWREEEELIQ